MNKKIYFIGLLVFQILAVGCDDAAESQIKNVDATVSEHISTVITVTWETDLETVGYVEFGPTEDFGLTTPVEAEPNTVHQALLLGMTPDTEVHYRVVIWEGEDSEGEASEAATITTGPRLAGLPSLNFDDGESDQYVIVPLMVGFDGPVIINPDGELVWYWEDDRELEFFRARLSLDGTSILYNAANVSGDPSAESEIVRVSLDGSTVETYPVPMLAHDFIEMEDGTIAAIAIEYREYEHEDLDDNMLRGDSIVEIDPTDGSYEVVWSAWDCLDPAETEHENMAQGWTFANALDYDPGEDAYYLGTLNLSSIIKIDRTTGECPVIFGGIAQTAGFEGLSYPWHHQHQFQIKGDSVLVFDNSGTTPYSRVVEYDYDEGAQTLSQTWECEVGVSTFVLGEVTRLPGGDTMVTWSSNGLITRLAPNCDILWEVGTNMGYTFGFHTVTPSLYGEWATWSN